MKRHVNLIPSALRRRHTSIRQIRVWIVACGCVLAIGGMLWNRQHAICQKLCHHVDQLDRQYEPARLLGKQSEMALNEIKSQQMTVRWLRSLEQAEVPLITLAGIHQSISRLDGRVQLERLRLEGLDAPAPSTPRNAQVADPSQSQQIERPIIPINNQVELFGSAVDDDTVGELIDHIENTGLFFSVELINLQGDSARNFHIRCRVQADVEQFEDLAYRLRETKNISTASHQNEDAMTR
ncbi:PilN domain-containing protein [Thalassoroseus pseudoceratinae]|uniref:PilN domain-containing protein n=1 Tax=Thalassoroseus pseudoceratinae TaxID=2713176 RepID=UPI001423C76F|nr:PilN domain-containing protein [Thalassoroseus pseudoceratinae]